MLKRGAAFAWLVHTCAFAWCSRAALAQVPTPPTDEPSARPQIPAASAPAVSSAATEPPAPDDPSLPAASGIVPPSVRSAPVPQLKPGQLAPAAPSDVRLVITVGLDGKVSDPEVVEGVREDLDALAIETVLGWEFEPARRDGQVVSARVMVGVHFEPPTVVASEPTGAPAETPDGPDASSQPPLPANIPTAAREAEAPGVQLPAGEGDTPQTVDETTEVVVQGERYGLDQPRSASDFSIEHDVLDAAPHHEGVDVLRAAPGLYMGRPEGGAVAHRYMLRGFDSEHGQDIEFRVGGIPINLPSHIHGQGYADLGFLIADVVHELRVTEGVHDPRQGDFAVAGSIDVKLGMEQRGLTLRSSYGSFGTFEQLAAWAPQDALQDTFAAVELRHTDGFGTNRNGDRGSAILQQGFTLLDWRVRLLGIAYAARSDLAGLLRRDDIESGKVDYYSAYPYPTAQAQNALALRGLVGVFGEYNGLLGDRYELGFWLSKDQFRIQQNLTGFVETSLTLAGVAGRGDLIEQRNQSDSIGFWGRYRTEAKELGPLHVHVEMGTATRIDQVEQEQNLLDAAVRGQTWDERVAAEIAGTDIGLWLDTDVHIAEWLKLRAGYRADLLGYEVNDALGNRPAAVRDDDTFITGFRRSSMGIAHGPRVSTDVEIFSPLTLHASYGEGYRSPQARTLADGESTPFSKVRSADVGSRVKFGFDTSLTASLYHTHLSDDVVFDATEGRLERVGATTRRGAVIHVETRPWNKVVGSVSLTYVDAELLEPPPPTAEDPAPAFTKGQNLPFVPPLVARADLSAERTLVVLRALPLAGRFGMGVSHLGSRPLPYGTYGQAFTLIDGSLGVSYGVVTLGASVYNILNLQYPAAEYSYVSQWSPDEPGSRLPARHIAAGAPRSVMFSLELDL